MPRPTDWVDTIINQAVNNGGETIIDLLSSLSPADMRGATLIRTLVSLSFQSGTVAGAWGTQRFDTGIGISSQEAFAASALPDPSSSTDKPARGWIYRTSVGVSQNGAGSPVLFERVADIRGARKIENGDLFIIFNNTAILGTSFNGQVMGLIRLLIKLS